ncbi:lysozyme inhibitor LprI family protein [Rubrimonas cliftonensis]|uniref:Lysozyme inhibitor LprI-like N-terminal domain-containing protein n=1 Tax=Rubrimonas cliftonensis TaxID=89524 RepID=A0A1H3VJR0_9RHOB|nr:lysozyme inhibitor LprI family protein [Rubrimonas cliftonensis]SDZ75009.1 Protein of unknown function [Rubrimonas cliftonensis]
MRRVIVAGLTAALIGGGEGAARAAEPPGPIEGAAALEACMTDEEHGDTCVGLISDPCFEAPGGWTTQGMVECFGAETAAWDALLNAYWPRVTEHESHAAEALLSAQRAWIAWRDADCLFHRLRHQGGTMGRVASAACVRDHTAQRVLDFRFWLMDP